MQLIVNLTDDQLAVLESLIHNALPDDLEKAVVIMEELKTVFANAIEAARKVIA